jgi:serine phosphatase RsbU (regulator of sigma subunit)
MTEHFLAAGDALLLYTDGLIERHDESLTEGFRRLKHAAVETHGLAADTVLPLIVRAMSGAQATDDIAALSVRRMS